ncbi:AAA family ATPase [Danxiaibacter flavus]|uniref:AAA family ATPase n=1 Tax=Danxiaibacter flavus TaxID=3049108 RepID=A0ABV3ZLT8_9BACT|nr:AAA family ATPase [Chitinophagaceae bacterium DXS]
MALIERDGFMSLLQKHFESIAGGEGHCILLSGEAGIGKTALVKAFCRKQAEECSIYQGACDALFTPRPLAPLYDVLWQVNKERWPVPPSSEERSLLFTNFFQELSTKKGRLLIVFEDIHWADEGTLDFIKFFVRRIYQLPCLFILTYRDDEIYLRNTLRNILGQLPPDSFTKMVLTPLSKQAVVELATQKGYSGEDVYSISEGNPFYVNEILASYSPGIPDNIKDSILAVYERQKEGTKNAWQIWSVMPEGLEIERAPKIRSMWDIDHCFAINVIVVENGKVVFKHELYRRTIEESLTPVRRMELNKMMLELFLDSFEEKGEIERILHYAKNANEKKLVLKYAPEAAKKVASIGAHKEASKLFLTAIEYFEGNDTDQLAEFYEGYAYECYLSNQIKEAIAFTEKTLALRKEKGDIEKTGKSLWFLSRLWWFQGNRENAENFAGRAIELLKDQPASSTKAMAFSTMSQLKMLSDEPTECIFWGEKAIEMAKELNNDEILSHAMNNVGTVQLSISSSEQKGITMLQQSLEIALKNSYHEHAARSYTNLGCGSIKMKNYAFAEKTLDEGIHYCEEMDLNSWTAYMLSWKARMELEKGNLTAARNIADNLLKNENQPAIIKITALIVLAKVMMRIGEKDALDLLLEAKAMSFETRELQRVAPAMIALLEYEWLTGKTIIEEEDIEHTSILMQRTGIDVEKNEFAFWMKKAGRQLFSPAEIAEAYDTSSAARVLEAATLWEKSGCPYEQALVLFEKTDEDKRNAATMIQDLGAMAVYEKMKQEMRNSGIKNIPRGIRNSTRTNAAFLTDREMDVLQLLKEELPNKAIAAQLYISPKTVDHHISSILFKLDANSRSKAVTEAIRMGILK